ncbi:MAG: hypothetical protein RBU37_02025 [Myxococcota bacterium]|nr:hypothetical protein [Myxococcota bacterium]
MTGSFDSERISAIFDECLEALDLELACACLRGGALARVRLHHGKLLEHSTQEHLLLELCGQRKGRFAAASTTELSPEGVLSLVDAVKRRLEEPRAELTLLERNPYSQLAEFDKELEDMGPAARIDALLEPYLLARREGIDCELVGTWTLGGVGFDGSLLPFAFAHASGARAISPQSALQVLGWTTHPEEPSFRDFVCFESSRREHFDPSTLLQASLGFWASTQRCIHVGGPGQAPNRQELGGTGQAPNRQELGGTGQAPNRQELGGTGQAPNRQELEALPSTFSLLLDAPVVSALLRPILHALEKPTHPWGQQFVLGRSFEAPINASCAPQHPCLNAIPFDAWGNAISGRSLITEGLVAHADAAAQLPVQLSLVSPDAALCAAAFELALAEQDLFSDATGLLLRSATVESCATAPELRLTAGQGAWLLESGAVVGTVAPFALRLGYDELFSASMRASSPRRALGCCVPAIRLDHFTPRLEA